MFVYISLEIQKKKKNLKLALCFYFAPRALWDTVIALWKIMSPSKY